MYKKIASIIWLAVFCYAPVNATAANISWSYIDGGPAYFDPDVDGADSEVGFALRGSYAIASRWYVTGGFSAIEFEASGPDVEVSAFTVGGGYVFPVKPNVDAFAQGSLVFANTERGTVDEDELGIEAKGGVRASVAPRVEALGFVAFMDIDNPFEDGIEIGGGGLYHVNRQFSVGGELTLDSNLVDGTELLFLARFNF
ncbi:MAG: hypothetical protein ACR2RB_04495 [Gammaproteobacteria bacterium]